MGGLPRGGMDLCWGMGTDVRVCAEEQVDTWVTSSNTILSNPCKDFSGGSDGKASAYNVGNPGSIPGLGRSPGEGNGNPLQYSCLEKSHGWRSMVGYSPQGRKESDPAEQRHFHFH